MSCLFFNLFFLHQLLQGMLEQPGSEKILEADLILLALGFLGAFLMALIHGSFHKWGTPIAGWFILENPIRVDDLGVSGFRKSLHTYAIPVSPEVLTRRKGPKTQALMIQKGGIV